MTELIDSEAVASILDRQMQASVSRKDLQQLLQYLAPYLGLDALVLDDNGTVAFVIDDETEISLTHQPDQPYLIAAAEMPDQPDSRGALLRRLLSSNLNYGLTHGGTFAMVPETNALVLCQQLDIADLDAARLDGELARFVELATAWRSEIGDYLEEIEDGAEGADPAPFVRPSPDQFV